MIICDRTKTDLELAFPDLELIFIENQLELRVELALSRAAEISD